MRKKTKQKLTAFTQQTLAEFETFVQEIEQRIARDKAIADAGERYLALTTTEEYINDAFPPVSVNLDLEINRLHMKKALSVAGVIVTSGGCMIAVTVLAATSLIPSLITGGALMLASIYGAIHHGADENNTPLSSAQQHISTSTAALQQSIQDEKENIITSHFQELTNSPHFETVYNKFPSVKEAFKEAAAQEALAPHVTRLDKPRHRKISHDHE